jgi:hypothetical protein
LHTSGAARRNAEIAADASSRWKGTAIVAVADVVVAVRRALGATSALPEKAMEAIANTCIIEAAQMLPESSWRIFLAVTLDRVTAACVEERSTQQRAAGQSEGLRAHWRPLVKLVLTRSATPDDVWRFAKYSDAARRRRARPADAGRTSTGLGTI